MSRKLSKFLSTLYSSDDIANMDSYEFLYVMANYFKTVPSDSDVPHIFFSGEGDGNQTI